MEQKLTCGNHSDEVILDRIGWTRFRCPKCGGDYSIGRKILLDQKYLAQQLC
ncbi:MAG: hypothetical protein KGH88_01715 [Thaumarchaeota archaeon]|nr:hypothetical protein [Nitrososphaerota archaeon]